MFKEKTVNVNRKENKKPMNKKTDRRKYTYIPKNCYTTILIQN